MGFNLLVQVVLYYDEYLDSKVHTKFECIKFIQKGYTMFDFFTNFKNLKFSIVVRLISWSKNWDCLLTHFGKIVFDETQSCLWWKRLVLFIIIELSWLRRLKIF